MIWLVHQVKSNFTIQLDVSDFPLLAAAGYTPACTKNGEGTTAAALVYSLATQSDLVAAWARVIALPKGSYHESRSAWRYGYLLRLPDGKRQVSFSDVVHSQYLAAVISPYWWAVGPTGLQVSWGLELELSWGDTPLPQAALDLLTFVSTATAHAPPAGPVGRGRKHSRPVNQAFSPA